MALAVHSRVKCTRVTSNEEVRGLVVVCVGTGAAVCAGGSAFAGPPFLCWFEVCPVPAVPARTRLAALGFSEDGWLGEWT